MSKKEASIPKKKRTLTLSVQPDHIDSLTRASGTDALSELVWNSLDADSTIIKVVSENDEAGNVTSLRVVDNGNGMSYEDAESAFGSLGGSAKKYKRYSPGSRVLHGKEGKGRFRALALGDLVNYRSSYESKGKKKALSITLDRNNLDKATLVEEDSSASPLGVTVHIENIRQPAANQALSTSAEDLIRTRFALYERNYPFTLSIDGRQINFSGLVVAESEKSFWVTEGVLTKNFTLTITEWGINCQERLFYCVSDSIPVAEDELGVKSRYSLTAHLSSPYIGELIKENRLDAMSLDPIIVKARSRVRDLIKDYLREKKASEARAFIEQLKREELYPYSDVADNKLEEAKRQVFDIVALQVNEHLPDFSDSKKENKKFTLSLIASALENSPAELERVLAEVVKLPKQKVKEFSDILDKTSLSELLDVMKEVTDRLRTLYELRLILFEKGIKEHVKERAHLHRIVRSETWIFGDDYALGADDVTLKSVLRAHIKELGREELEEVIEGGKADSLQVDRPDIVLFKQFNQGKAGYFENLVIELKRPSKIVGSTELQQIKRYAQKIIGDTRFDKSKTKWTFILLATELKEDAEFDMTQSDRPYGHIQHGDHYDIFVRPWGHVLGEAEARHQYLKDKLNFSVRSEDEGIKLLTRKYHEYLPEPIAELIGEPQGPVSTTS